MEHPTEPRLALLPYGLRTVAKTHSHITFHYSRPWLLGTGVRGYIYFFRLTRLFFIVWLSFFFFLLFFGGRGGGGGGGGGGGKGRGGDGMRSADGEGAA